jgi:hypothetical protein
VREKNFVPKLVKRWYFYYLKVIIGELLNEALHMNSEFRHLNDEKSIGITEKNIKRETTENLSLELEDKR